MISNKKHQSSDWIKQHSWQQKKSHELKLKHDQQNTSILTKILLKDIRSTQIFKILWKSIWWCSLTLTYSNVSTLSEQKRIYKDKDNIYIKDSFHSETVERSINMTMSDWIRTRTHYNWSSLLTLTKSLWREHLIDKNDVERTTYALNAAHSVIHALNVLKKALSINY